MYIPRHFEENRLDVLQEFIRAYLFGTLITATSAGLDANHIPFLLDREVGPYGVLRAHVARANSQWASFSPREEALVVFQGPQAYISPSWYPTKRETGKVVPTWNYVAVHAYGHLRVVEDQAWLLRQVEELTTQQEEGREVPWRVSDAPADFTEKLLGAIVGLELHVTRLLGKWKLGQNRSVEDQHGILDGLNADGKESASRMARLMRSSLQATNTRSLQDS